MMNRSNNDPGRPKISVVMALKDKESTVKRAVQSVLDQNVADFEVIIIDGSSDRGPEMVRSIDDRRVVVIPEKGRGVGAARNQGISLTSADLIAFLDADDEYTPNFFETALRMVTAYPEASAFYQMSEVVEKDGSKRSPLAAPSEKVPPNGIVERYFHIISEGGPSITSSSVVVRRSVLMDLEGFSEETWYGEDTFLWGRIALGYKVAFDSNIGSIYHRDAPNRLTDRLDNPGENVLIPVLEKALEQGGFGKRDKEDIEEYIAKLRFSSVYRFLLSGDRKGARKILKKTKTERYQVEKAKWYLWTLVPQRVFLSYHLEK